MNKTVLSDEQRRAAECLDRSVVLTAGAGCGKTATLVERYVNILKQGLAEVDSIAAITFTEKAAGELKGRIRERLRQLRRDSTDPVARRRWDRHLMSVEAASIGTIHGFCAEILREFPAEAGVDPEFEVLDESVAGPLAAQAVEAALFEAAGADDSAKRLLARFGLAGLSQMVSHSMEKREHVRVFHASIELDFEDPFALASALKARVMSQVVPVVHESLSSPVFEKAVSRLAETPGPAGDAIEKKRADFLDAHGKWKNASAAGAAAALLNMRLAAPDTRGGSPRKWGAEKLEKVKADLKTVSTLCGKASALIDGLEREDWPARAAEIADFLRLHRLALAAYSERKREQGRLDFDDLLIAARDLLADEGAAAAVARRCSFLLVDEFQDTDHVQCEIIRRLERKGSNLFIVGDAEQSIYGFRGAEVETLAELTQDYLESGDCVALSIKSNYRSRPHVIDFVNFYFTRAMPAGSGQARWRTSHRPLAAQRPASGRRIELLIAENGVDMRHARRIEAQAIAARIKDILADEQILIAEKDGKDALRRPGRGDIALLFRSLSSVEIYERALREAGIRYYTVAGSTFYMRSEVRDIVNLLRFIVDDEDSLSLVGALRSPLFGVSDDYLATLACDAGLARYFRDEPPPAGGSHDASAFRLAARLVRELRAAKNRLGMREIVDRIYEATGYPAAVSMLFGGGQKLANVMSLADAASQFDFSGRGTPEDFIARISELELEGARESEAVVEEEEREAVRLMSVHAAKGLEFPIVILADMGRKPRALNDPVELDRLLGIALPAAADAGNAYLDLMRWSARDKEEAEERRVFFVAATRARDHLIMSGARRGSSVGWAEEALELLEIDEEAPGDYEFGSFAVEYSCPRETAQRHVFRKAPLAALRDTVLSDRALAGAPPSPPHDLAGRIDPLPPAAAVDRLTATAIGDFQRCPLKYELTHIRGIPADYALAEGARHRADALSVGTALHSVFETVRGPETLNQALERVLAADVQYAGRAEPLRRAIAPILERVVVSEFYRRIEKAGGRREVPFSFLFEGVLVEGKVDRMLDAEVIDFKSDDVAVEDVEEHAMRYRGQLDAYALAFRRLNGAPPGKLTLYFLRPGVEFSRRCGPAGLEQAADRLRGTVSSLAKGPPYAARTSGECRCEHLRICRLISAARSSREPGPRPAPE